MKSRINVKMAALIAGCSAAWCATSLQAETIILKDGTFVEGTIVRETSRMIRVETRFGTRSFFKRDVDQILESLSTDEFDVNRFAELPDAVKAVLNAQTDYKLQNYEQALKRIEPFLEDKSNPAIAIQIDWLHIETLERLGRWERVRKLLEEKVSSGTPREQTRAQAHLDIIKANPSFDLRFVGDRHARSFIMNPSLRERARESGSLRDARVMRAALEEYCEQLLVQDKLSVKAFADRLDLQETYDALTSATGRGGIADRLPYAEDLKKAEASLYKAQSVLGEYGAAFELDLIRTEITHLLNVFLRMFGEMLETSPESFNPQVDQRTGRLTADGRREWRRRCDEFIDKGQSVRTLLDYLEDKAERYPRDLKQLYDLILDLKERLDQIVKSVRRDRDRVYE